MICYKIEIRNPGDFEPFNWIYLECDARKAIKKARSVSRDNPHNIIDLFAFDVEKLDEVHELAYIPNIATFWKYTDYDWYYSNYCTPIKDWQIKRLKAKA